MTRRTCGIIVRPQPDDLPSGFRQPRIRVAVTAPIPLDLLSPPSRVRLRPRPMCRAAVPEAAVHEQGYARRCEGEIGAASMAPKPVTKARRFIGGGMLAPDESTDKLRAAVLMGSG